VGFGYLYRHYSHTYLSIYARNRGKTGVGIQDFGERLRLGGWQMMVGSDDVYIVRLVCGVYIFLVGYSASLSAWSGSSGSLEASSA